jgi:hypothetical protein
MTGKELIELMQKSHRRVHITGSADNGIISALDLEGRLFVTCNGRVLNRVVPSAIIRRSNREIYQNPGGDALWPAPEGSRFGYEYNTGKWRVPPSITGAVWEVKEESENTVVIKAEIDLVNNLQTGIPCEFERHILFRKTGDLIIQDVTELIRYIGVRSLAGNEFRLAPWSLCQFGSAKGCKVVMSETAEREIHDMYVSSLSKRRKSGDKYLVDTETDFRFQLGMGANVEWIEYHFADEFKVKRYTGPLPDGQDYIDITDSPPDQYPSADGIRFSVYCDPSGFMEIEACGGCTGTLVHGTELKINIITVYDVNPGRR